MPATTPRFPGRHCPATHAPTIAARYGRLMQLASLQPLAAPALAGGVLLFGVGALRPDSWIGRARSTVGVVLLALVTLVGIVGGFLGMGLLLEANPEQAPVVCVAGMIILGIVGFAVHTRRTDPPSVDKAPKADEDGGGGQRRKEPEPKPQTPPAAPTGPGVPWHEFDDLRADWDRVPAGRS